MSNDVRQAIAASITPELVREACDEARARATGRAAADFYAFLALALKRRIAQPVEAQDWAVILIAADGGIRALLSADGTRFIEPRSVRDDLATGALALWFSVHHVDEIAPFASEKDAQAAVDRVVEAVGQPKLRERMRIVPAMRRGEQELLLYLAAKRHEGPAKKPEEFLSTQVFQAFVVPAKKSE